VANVQVLLKVYVQCLLLNQWVCKSLLSMFSKG